MSNRNILLIASLGFGLFSVITVDIVSQELETNVKATLDQALHNKNYAMAKEVLRRAPLGALTIPQYQHYQEVLTTLRDQQEKKITEYIKNNTTLYTLFKQMGVGALQGFLDMLERATWGFQGKAAWARSIRTLAKEKADLNLIEAILKEINDRLNMIKQ
ncbi:MAG TPA: hypothetical protein VHA52_01895 [Candidatus Babeliaceae bacterium]|nr:hypothetical protein [Candidatus Babeliaceae bacterium]